MESKRQVKYTSRDFNSLHKDLIDYTKLYFSNSYGDFTPTSPGMMMMELVAYVGDVLSYYQDRQYNELFNPNEKKNAIRLLSLFGGKYKAKTQSSLVATIYIVVPSAVVSGEIQPDEDYLPIIRKGFRAGTDNNIQFISTEDVDFRDESNREIAVYSQDNNGVPTYYAIRKPVNMVSGKIDNFSYSVGDPESFLKIELPSDRNILEIISVVDDVGDNWREVEYLAQDDILISEPNQNAQTKYDVPLLVKSETVPKRFITETDHDGVTRLIFGDSVGTLDSGVIFPNPNRFLVNSLSDAVGSFQFNSNLLLSSGSLGLSPANTILTISYLYGGGSESNIRQNELRNILDKQVIFQKEISLLDNTKYNNVINSISVNNTQQGKDGVDEFTVEELKQLIPIFYSSQKRAVSLEDFYAILYSMPAKFGSIYKVVAVADSEAEKSIALHILSKDRNNKLAIGSNELKENIKMFLRKYRMITDNINIYDGEIVNFGIMYEIIIKDGYNIDDVKERVNQKIYEFYTSVSFNFGQSIYISKLVTLIDDVDGVLSVTDVTLQNKIGSTYSDTQFAFKVKNISNIITPRFNQIFELKYKTDISGKVRTF